MSSGNTTMDGGAALSLKTLVLLRGLLRQQQLVVGAEDFPATARDVLDALEELDAAIGAQPSDADR